ncbi:MAG: hypothetical protein AAB250_13080, partial [Bdellovibrionota bacterium]
MKKTEVELFLDKNRRDYIPPTRKPRPTDDLNLNPFSTKGHLDGLSFVATLVILVVLLYLGNHVIRGYLQMARVSVDQARTFQWYGIWTLMSIVGFLMIHTAFVKRWNFLLGHSMGSSLRMVFRLMLLSPLLSVWLTFFTLINGPAMKGARFVAAVATLILFHMGVVGWMLYDGAVTAGPGLTVHLAQGRSPERSLSEILPVTAPRFWVPSEAFVVHAHPYL